MRTAWKLNGLTIHTFIPCMLPEHKMLVVTGVDAISRRLEIVDARLVGVFRITGMHNINEDLALRYVEDTVLIAVVERHHGTSFHEFENGVNLSDGCFTLYNNVTPFNPAILRSVMKNIDCTKLERRIQALALEGVDGMTVTNPCPFQILIDIFEATCPRCCEDWSQREFEKLFLQKRSLSEFERGRAMPIIRPCPSCGLQLVPYYI